VARSGGQVADDGPAPGGRAVAQLADDLVEGEPPPVKATTSVSLSTLPSCSNRTPSGAAMVQR